jgi:hypothetical protein
MSTCNCYYFFVISFNEYYSLSGLFGTSKKLRNFNFKEITIRVIAMH